ncbi:hypothetical protein E2C01_057454 [Portunus trituberculatus]|uniref:Uncharacterized protein n=1 Tax=Portunus trituberculatus TaxID=210409 RepID=A0A5B7H0I7_PORTR|nr:hypothetical protein [Portunus trituberculatus]
MFASLGGRVRTKQSGNLAYSVVKRVTYSLTWAGRLPYARSRAQTLSEVNRIPSIILSAKMRYCSRLGVNYSSRFIGKERKSEEDRNCRSRARRRSGPGRASAAVNGKEN